MCCTFLAGNDFVPQLPSLDIYDRPSALQTLLDKYKARDGGCGRLICWWVAPLGHGCPVYCRQCSLRSDGSRQCHKGMWHCKVVSRQCHKGMWHCKVCCAAPSLIHVGKQPPPPARSHPCSLVQELLSSRRGYLTSGGRIDSDKLCWLFARLAGEEEATFQAREVKGPGCSGDKCMQQRNAVMAGRH